MSGPKVAIPNKIRVSRPIAQANKLIFINGRGMLKLYSSNEEEEEEEEEEEIPPPFGYLSV